jgi:hypothetical protein
MTTFAVDSQTRTVWETHAYNFGRQGPSSVLCKMFLSGHSKLKNMFFTFVFFLVNPDHPGLEVAINKLITLRPRRLTSNESFVARGRGRNRIKSCWQQPYTAGCCHIKDGINTSIKKLTIVKQFYLSLPSGFNKNKGL